VDPPVDQHRENDGSVRHLFELGYVDPVAEAARESSLRDLLESELSYAASLRKHQRYEEAVAVLEKLTRDDPDWISPHQMLAEIHFRLGKWSKAQVQLDWLTYHGVERPRLAMMSGALAIAKRDLPAAVELLEYARHLEPDLPGVQTLYATALLRQGKLTLAADSFQDALQRNPNDARALDGVAAICLRTNDFEGAADWALRSLEQNMQLSQAHFHLGVALAHLDRSNEAIAAFETFARLEPDRAAPYYWLARLAERQVGDFARAQNYRMSAKQILCRRRARREMS
jgi:tetratricopeptide (TPR) repeat protein